MIDYRSEDFTHSGQYDVVVDFVARRSVFAYCRTLAPGGRYLMVGGTVRTMLRLLTVGTAIGAATGRRLRVLAVPQGPEHFLPVADLVLTGEVSLQIDSSFALSQADEALQRHGTGKALGKVVVDMAPEARAET